MCCYCGYKFIQVISIIQKKSEKVFALRLPAMDGIKLTQSNWSALCEFFYFQTTKSHLTDFTSDIIKPWSREQHTNRWKRGTSDELRCNLESLRIQFLRDRKILRQPKVRHVSEPVLRKQFRRSHRAPHQPLRSQILICERTFRKEAIIDDFSSSCVCTQCNSSNPGHPYPARFWHPYPKNLTPHSRQKPTHPQCTQLMKERVFIMKKANTYEIDFVNEQIIVSKAFLKASATLGTPEYDDIQLLRKENPTFRFVKREISRRPERSPIVIWTIPTCANLSLQRKERKAACCPNLRWF